MENEGELYGSPKEVLTPYKLVIASLIREYLRLRRDVSHSSQKLSSRSNSAKEKEREECRLYIAKEGIDLETVNLSPKEMFDSLRILQHLMRTDERPFVNLIRFIQPVLHKAHLYLLWRFIESLQKDDPEEALKYLETYFDSCLKSICAKTDCSPAALYIRNVRLLISEMGVVSFGRLTSQLSAYVGDGLSLLANSNRAPRIHQKAASPKELFSRTAYVAHQEDWMLNHNPPVAHWQLSISQRLEAMLNPKPTAENVHFGMFLDALRRKEFNQATNILHKYFDMKVDSENFHRDGGAGALCLHLCMMHHDLGNYTLALRYLQECIFISHERNDIHILTQAMYWVAVLEANNHQLDKIVRGENSADAGTYAEVRSLFSVLKSQYEVMNGSLLARALAPLDNLEREAHLGMNVSHYKVAVGTNRAAVWKAYGFHDLAALHAQLTLQTFASGSRSRFSFANEHVAASAAIMIENALDSHDDGAVEVLVDFCSDILPPKAFPDWHIWGLSVLISKYQKSLLMEQCSTCAEIVEQILPINRTEALIRKAELMSHSDHAPLAALRLVEEMLQTCIFSLNHTRCFEEGSILTRVRLLLLKADILLRYSSEMQALTVLLDALGLVVDHPNDLLRAKVEMHMAFCWLSLEEYAQAANALEAVFPILCGSRFLVDQAKCWYLKGQLLWAKMRRGELADAPVLQSFTKALEGFSTCQYLSYVLKTIHCLVAVHDALGDVPSRDQYMEQFLDFHAKYPHVTCT